MSTTHLRTIDDLMAMLESEPFELIEGELIKVSPSGAKSSMISLRIGSLILEYAERNGLGYVTGEAGGFILSTSPDTVVAPDVGFIRSQHAPDGPPERGYWPVPPDLAVEVISPTDEPQHILRKQQLYESTAIPIVWWVDPTKRVVTVRVPDLEPQIAAVGDFLDGLHVLPGFRIAVAEIFDQ